jgi:hypothetical protein
MVMHESHQGEAVSLQIAAPQDGGLFGVKTQSGTEISLYSLLNEAKEPTLSRIEGIIQIKEDISRGHRHPQKYGCSL